MRDIDRSGHTKNTLLLRGMAGLLTAGLLTAGLLTTVLLLNGCDSGNGTSSDGSNQLDSGQTADVSTQLDGQSDRDQGSQGPDAASQTDGGGPSTCPLPQVYCEMAIPQCPAGQVPEADPCPGGHCDGRCWTGTCVPCGTECQSDSDCLLVGRHGCCGPAGDCAKGCFWAAPASTLTSDPCTFQAVCPIPSPPPEGCPTDCVPNPSLEQCKACPHCGPGLARCEGGLCVSAWPSCEPDCMCD